MSDYSVLVVENDDNLRAGIKNSLKNRGVNTIIEDTKGAKAFSLLKKQKFDLVILDIDLPGVNGFLIVNRIKKNDSFKDIPLVVISTKSDEEKFKKHREASTPANMYLHLPLSNDELVNRVFTLLEDPLDIDLSLDSDDDLDLGLDDDILGSSLNSNDDLDLGLDDDILGDSLDGDLDLGLDDDILGDSLDGDDDLDLGLDNDDILGDSLDSSDDLDLGLDDDVLGDSLEESLQENLEDEQSLSIDVVKTPQENISSEELEKLEEDLMERDIQIEELTKQLTDLTLKLSEHVEVETVDVSEFENKITSLETELKSKNNKVSDLNRLLSEASSNSGSSTNRDVLKLKQELTQKGRDIIEYKELYNSKEREVLDLKDNCNTLELKIADQDDLISGYRRKISSTEDELQNLKTNHASLTEERNTLLSAKDTLENNLSDKEILISGLTEKVESYEKEISDLKLNLEEKNKEINDVLLPNKQALEVDLDRYKNDYNNLTTKFETLDSNYNDSQDKIILLEKRTSDNLEEFKNIELQKSKIKQLLEAATGIIDGVVVN